MWTEKLKLNHSETLERGTCGPDYRNDSEWGRHAAHLDNTVDWYKAGVYLIWVRNKTTQQVELVYIGEGEIQQRLCFWEEHNLGCFHVKHRGTEKFMIDYPNQKPTYWCQYFYFDEADKVNAERHLMWLYQNKQNARTKYNGQWIPEQWTSAPDGFGIPE